MSLEPSRRHFLAIVGPGAVGTAIAGCSSSPASASGDLADARDLSAARDLGGDLATPRDLGGEPDGDMTAPQDMSTPDLAPSSDLASPPDLACGGVPVPAAQMPGMDQAILWAEQGVFIAQDAAGYMALSPICAHRGCRVIYVPRAGGQAFMCPCHAASFTLAGDIISGLSPLPLDHVGLCWKDESKQELLLNPGVLISDTSQRA